MPIGILSVQQFADRYSGTTTHNPLNWLKLIMTTPTDPDAPGTIPKAQYSVQAIGNSKVLCYGENHPSRAPKVKSSDPENRALFTMVGAVDLAGSNFGPFGGAKTKPPVSLSPLILKTRI